MFTTLVLALNLIALAGILLGLLLKNERVRECIDYAYISIDELVVGNMPTENVSKMVDAFLQATFVTRSGRLSKTRIALLATISCSLLWIGLGFRQNLRQGPFGIASQLLGQSPMSSFAGNAIFFLMAWVPHFVYEYFASYTLLKVWRKTTRTPPISRTFYISLALVGISLLPLLTLLPAYYLLDKIGINPPSVSSGVFGILYFVPIFNGPTLFWLTPVALVLGHNEIYGALLGMPAVTFMILSSCVTLGLLFVALAAQQAARNRRLLHFLQIATLQVSSLSAERLYLTSLTLFAVGNGLCQLFGISIKLE